MVSEHTIQFVWSFQNPRIHAPQGPQGEACEPLANLPTRNYTYARGVPVTKLVGAAARNAAGEPTQAMQAQRFKPGNPGGPGRSRGLERRVRELVDFDLVILTAQDIALGKLPPGITGETTVKIKDRLEACKFLCDRGFGKARAIVDHLAQDMAASVDVDALGDEDFDQLAALVDRLQANRKGGGADRPYLEVPAVVVPTLPDK